MNELEVHHLEKTPIPQETDHSHPSDGEDEELCIHVYASLARLECVVLVHRGTVIITLFYFNRQFTSFPLSDCTCVFYIKIICFLNFVHWLF
jgi:hypothetical protein